MDYLCKGQISPKYIRSHTKGFRDPTTKKWVSSDADFLFFTNNTRGDTVNFAICKIEGSTLFISAICASFGGADLLKYIINYATLNGFRRVQLAALSHVVNFYKKYGFKPSETCTVDESIEKIDVQLTQLNGKYKVFSSPEDALADQKFKNYLMLLVKKGLAYDKTCKGVENCSDEGFLMTICLNR